MHIRTAEPEDAASIKKLYRSVAGHSNALARREHEISDEYIDTFLKNSFERGLCIVAEHPENAAELIGEIHGYSHGIEVFNHVYSNVTIAIHPDFQGKKIGRTLLTIFLEEIGMNRQHIGRVELMTKESNSKAISFYQSMGFLVEGRMEMRIKNTDGSYEADIAMAWQNPNFQFD